MANRYWVGGTASWDATAGTKWALTSGGAGGQAVPTASDDVFFDAASGAVTVTKAGVTGLCNNLDFTGFAGTFAQSNLQIIIAASLTLSATMTFTGTGILAFSAASGLLTITTNGKTIPGSLSIGTTVLNSATWTLQDDLTTTGNITISNGTWDTNNKNVSCSALNASGAGIRAVTLGTSSITITTGAGTSLFTGSNLTLSAVSSTITFTGTGPVFSGLSSQTFGTFIFSGATSASLLGGFTISTLTVTGSASPTAFISTDSSFTVAGTLTLTGNSSVNRLNLLSNMDGINHTVTAATLSATNVNFQNITGAGLASWNVSSTPSGDLGGNSGITFMSGQTIYWFNNTGNMSDTTKWFTATNGGGSNITRPPLPQDVLIFDSNSFNTSTRVITNDIVLIPEINFTGSTNTPTLAIGNAGFQFFSNITLISAMSTTNGTAPLYRGSGTSTIISAGRQIGTSGNLIIRCGGTLKLGDNWLPVTTIGAFNIQAGTLDMNGFNMNATTITVGLASQTNPGVLTLGSGTLTLSGTGNIFVPVVGLNTVNAGTSTIVVSDTSATIKTFNTLGNSSITLNNFTINGASGAAAVTMNTLSIAGTLTLQPGSYLRQINGQTINIGTLVATGTSPLPVKIDAQSGTGTLNSTTGTLFSGDFMNITSNNATGASFYAGANSVDNGGNTGWIFAAGGTIYNALFMMGD